jgi:hypothetical protein
MSAARSVLTASWVLLGTDIFEYLCSAVARWFKEKGDRAAGTGGSGGAVLSSPRSGRAAAR